MQHHSSSLISSSSLKRLISVRIRPTVKSHSNRWVALKISAISEHFRIISTTNATNPSPVMAGKRSTGMIGKIISLGLSAAVPRKQENAVMTYLECNTLVNIHESNNSPVNSTSYDL